MTKQAFRMYGRLNGKMMLRLLSSKFVGKITWTFRIYERNNLDSCGLSFIFRLPPKSHLDS